MLFTAIYIGAFHTSKLHFGSKFNILWCKLCVNKCFFIYHIDSVLDDLDTWIFTFHTFITFKLNSQVKIIDTKSKFGVRKLIDGLIRVAALFHSHQQLKVIYQINTCGKGTQYTALTNDLWSDNYTIMQRSQFVQAKSLLFLYGSDIVDDFEG